MKFSKKVKYAKMKLLLTQEAQIVFPGKFYAFCESKDIKFDD